MVKRGAIVKKRNPGGTDNDGGRVLIVTRLQRGAIRSLCSS